MTISLPRGTRVHPHLRHHATRSAPPWSAGERPDFPACWLGEITVHNRHHVFWVTVGQAQCNVNGQTLTVGRDQCVWIPAGTTVTSIVTEPGTVGTSALISPGNLVGQPRWLGVCDLSGADSDVLARQFSRWSMPYWTDSGSAVRNSPTPPSGTTAGVPVPYSRAARTIAESVLRDPAENTCISDWAEKLGTSSRQITRQFHAETGMSYRDWRTMVRIDRARQLLRHGESVAGCAAVVGFTSAPAFIRAFRALLGTTPGAWADIVRYHSPSAPSGNDHLHHSAVNCLGGLPPVRTMPRVNRYHILIWIRCGTGSLDLGDGQISLKAGDTIWIPAGVWHVVTLDEGAVLVPVGELPASVPMRRHLMSVVSTDEGKARDLMYRAGINYTHLRPWPFEWNDPANMLDLLPPSVTPYGRPDAVISRILESDPVKGPRTLTRWSEQLGIPLARLSARFRRETGQSFTVWLSDLRMNRARVLLSTPGTSVTRIAGEVGYPTVSGFTRAFTSRHGMTPTEFRRRYMLSVLYEEVTG